MIRSETALMIERPAAEVWDGLWRLLSPLIAMEGKAGPERDLRRLKTNVEMLAPPVSVVPGKTSGW